MNILKYKLFLFILIGLSLLLSSCSIGKLNTTKITYQSVRTTFAQPDDSHPIPEDAEIVVAYSIDGDGDLTVIVFNRTDEIMTIDQTKSFFVNTNGVSTSYYDPIVRTTSTTNTSSSTSGGSVNLGSIAGAFGVGGPVGTLLGGVNVGGADTYGSSTTYITQVADMPEVSLSPHSQAAMSKVYNISNLDVNTSYSGKQLDMNQNNSYCTFSVCISYSIDNGYNFKKIVTYFYANSRIGLPVTNNSKVNDAIRELYIIKPDAADEPYYMLNFVDNKDDYHHIRNGSYYIHGILYDYQ